MIPTLFKSFECIDEIFCAYLGAAAVPTVAGGASYTYSCIAVGEIPFIGIGYIKIEQHVCGAGYVKSALGIFGITINIPEQSAFFIGRIFEHRGTRALKTIIGVLCRCGGLLSGAVGRVKGAEGNAHRIGVFKEQGLEL